MKNYDFSFNEVNTAYERIKSYLQETPLVQSFFLDDQHRKYFFKLETLQRTKSFKVRGALNKMLSMTAEERKHGVITISSGNHGCAVGYAASLLGIEKVVVIVPETSPESKVKKIKFFGAEIIQHGRNNDEAWKWGMDYISKTNMTYIDSYYEDIKVYGGQGTTAIELLRQNPDIDTIIVPLGGGSLLTGTAVAAKALKPDVRVIGIQTAACPAFIKAYEDNVFYKEYSTEETICDSLVGGVGALSYAVIKDYVDDLIAVSEDSIGRAVSYMAKEEKIIAEPGSCTTVAAVMEHRERIGGKNIALIISGANIDGELLEKLMKKY